MKGEDEHELRICKYSMELRIPVLVIQVLLQGTSLVSLVRSDSVRIGNMVYYLHNPSTEIRFGQIRPVTNW